MENPKGVGGSYMKFPPWWGYGYFLELHNEKITQCVKQIHVTEVFQAVSHLAFAPYTELWSSKWFNNLQEF